MATPLNVQDLINLAYKLSYSDSTQIVSADAVNYANMVYKEMRNSIVSLVSENYGADYFTTPLILNQSEYDIPTIVGTLHGMDKTINVIVDYVPNGNSAPRKATNHNMAEMNQSPQFFMKRQPITQPLYEIFDSSIFIYPSPVTNNFSFNLSGVSVFPNPGDQYSNNGIGFKVINVNNVLNTMEMSIYSGSSIGGPGALTPSISGTLTLVPGFGNGDATITFTSWTSNAGTLTLFGTTLAPDLTSSSTSDNIEGIPEYYHYVMSLGMAKYMFLQRGVPIPKDISEEYELQVKNMCQFLQRRDATRITRDYTGYPNMQGAASGYTGPSPFSVY